ncbi:hypothetical protein STENM327S_07368 [Streptomyces tendae]
MPWSDIQDSTGSAAAIPRLLRKVARGDAETARAALGDLRKRICQYGFVVEQATAATVPFLWELAQRPQVSCRAQIIQLLKNIADAPAAGGHRHRRPQLLNHRENPVAGERAARQAVRARRDGLERLMAEDDTEITRATTEVPHSRGRSPAHARRPGPAPSTGRRRGFPSKARNGVAHSRPSG